MLELGRPLTAHDIEQVIFLNDSVEISAGAIKKIHETYQTILKASNSAQAIYGINTGFGALAEVRIDTNHQAILQRNIILSHAVGVGEPLDFFTAKTIALLRLNSLAQGYSGASPLLINHLLRLINANCAPFIPRKGSVGASGDLAPLAHLGLLLLGIGDAYIEQRHVTAQQALAHAGLKPIEFGLRDGLALINGTQAMSAVGAIALGSCLKLSKIADLAAALSLESLGGHMAPFDDRIHSVKPHPGQIKTAQIMRHLLLGRDKDKLTFNQRTQDPYSLRCIPQVHGATKDVISHVFDVVYRELNSVTDNPLIFINSENSDVEILSGGNFHGQHLALALDYLAMAMAELANISERRIELLLNPSHSNGLPPFLIENSGLNSGYMMLHVTASALVSENKILCHPASIDSIPTSANREDHVSMGMNAANKLLQVINNVTIVLAIEVMAGCQALDLRQLDYASFRIRKFHEMYRKNVPFRRQDEIFKDDLITTLSWFNSTKTICLFDELINHEK